MEIKFVGLSEADLPFVKEIYDYYALNTTFVYFTEPVTIENLTSFIPIKNPVYHSYIIYDSNGEKCGFCYFSRFRPREAFRISVEVTLYFKPGYTGKGYGKATLTYLEKQIKEAGFHTIMALIAGENTGSIRLFERSGFTCCAHLREVAEKFGKKLDLKMYQKIIG